jgi:hypothetical protein
MRRKTKGGDVEERRPKNERWRVVRWLEVWVLWWSGEWW